MVQQAKSLPHCIKTSTERPDGCHSPSIMPGLKGSGSGAPQSQLPIERSHISKLRDWPRSSALATSILNLHSTCTCTHTHIPTCKLHACLWKWELQQWRSGRAAFHGHIGSYYIDMEVITFRSCVNRYLVTGAHDTSQRESEHFGLTLTLSVSQRYQQECLMASEGSFPYNTGSANRWADKSNVMWGWGNGAAGNVLAVQIRRPAFESLRTHIKSGCSHMVSCLCSGAVIDHDLKQLGGGERGLFNLILPGHRPLLKEVRAETKGTWRW